MSRLSQFIDYMSVDKNYILFNYTDFTITKSMKKARRKHLRQKNKIK